MAEHAKRGGRLGTSPRFQTQRSTLGPTRFSKDDARCKAMAQAVGEEGKTVVYFAGNRAMARISLEWELNAVVHACMLLAHDDPDLSSSTRWSRLGQLRCK